MIIDRLHAKAASMHRHSSGLVIALVFLLSAAVGRAGELVDIKVIVDDTTGHYYAVELTTDVHGQKNLRYRMPVWIPGSYLVREYGQHVVAFAAKDQRGRSLDWSKEDKNTWLVETASAEKVTIRYRVYAFDTSIRSSFVDADRAFINPSSVCMYVVDRKDWQIRISFEYPNDWAYISSGLEPVKGVARTLHARNYDQLVDSPIEIGNHRVIKFEVDATDFELAVTGQGNVDPDTLIPYFERIISATHELMGGRIPFDRYVFLLQLAQSGGGGLEHRNSTVLRTSRWSFQPASNFRRFLGLVAHEFFHAWNVKALKPYPLGPFNYDGENHSTMLWIAEGFTSYYGSRILLKAGLNTEKRYISGIQNGIQRLQRSPGRKVQSLAEASFDAWVKAYRSNENSFNTTISYYSKGSQVALVLDLLIRHETRSQKSLDDVFHRLYDEFVTKNPRAYRFAEFKKICEEMAGTDLTQFFDRYVFGTEEIDFKKYLGYAGFNLELDSAPATGAAALGLGTQTRNGSLVATRVTTGSPAYRSGINVGDELLAIDGFRLSAANLERIVSIYSESDRPTILVSRAGMIRRLSLDLTSWDQPGFKLKKEDEPGDREAEIASAWLFSSGGKSYD